MKGVKCPECGSTHVIRSGYSVTRQGRKQRLQCRECGRTFLAPEGFKEEKEAEAGRDGCCSTAN